MYAPGLSEAHRTSLTDMELLKYATTQTGCTNYSLNRANCSLNQANCSLNQANCSLNHANCSLNQATTQTGCSSGTKCHTVGVGQAVAALQKCHTVGVGQAVAALQSVIQSVLDRLY
jgi:hypothetical protein